MKRRSKNFEFHFTMILYDLFKTILVFLIATTFALCLQEADVMNDNIFGVYMLAVAITSSITSGYFWGIVASFCGVVGVNFFFTFPYFALNFTLAGYPVTFGILLLMSILTSALTAKVKQAAILSSIREKRAESLNSMSKALLSANNIDEIMQITIDSVYAANQCSAVLYIGSPISPEKKVTKYVNEKDELILESILEQQVAEQAFQKGEMTGLGTEKTSQNCLGTYIPFSNKDRIYGVLGLLFSKNGYIENDALQFANFMTSQTILAIDRQEIVDESQKILLEKEKENFYAHPNNMIDNELGFHQLLISLYGLCYEDTKVAYAKIVPLMEFSRLHIYAWEIMRGEEHPYYMDILADLLRCCIGAEEYEKAIEVGEEWCGRIEEGDEDYIAAMVTLGKLYGQVGMISKQKRCFRLVKDSPLFEELNAMSLSELCR